MSTFSHFAIKKLYFKQSLNNMGGNCGPFFSQTNADQTYFRGGLSGEGLVSKSSFR